MHGALYAPEIVCNGAGDYQRDGLPNRPQGRGRSPECCQYEGPQYIRRLCIGVHVSSPSSLPAQWLGAKNMLILLCLWHETFDRVCS